MMNEAIVGQLFSMFKEEYGYAIDDAAGLFDGQRDMLEFLMKLGKKLEQKFFEGLGSGYLGPKHTIEGVEYRFKGHRRREIHGLFGKIELRRAYYVGPRGSNCHPLDERLEEIYRRSQSSRRPLGRVDSYTSGQFVLSSSVGHRRKTQPRHPLEHRSGLRRQPPRCRDQ